MQNSHTSMATKFNVLLKVLGSKEVLIKEEVQAYQGLIESLTESEIEDSILPHIFRLAKRSPESVLNSATLSIKFTRHDLSASAEKSIAELVPLLRHSRDTVRQAS